MRVWLNPQFDQDSSFVLEKYDLISVNISSLQVYYIKKMFLRFSLNCSDDLRFDSEVSSSDLK